MALTLALFAGNLAVCAGWAATPEARMACCAGPDCPMHKSDSSDSDGPRVSQTEADRCCAMSESGTSTPSTPTSAIFTPATILLAAVVLPVEPPSLVLSDAWRGVTPLPATGVAKHLLLSVFLL
jgi:hypothetical protein